MEHNQYVIIDLEMCKIFDEKIIKEKDFKTEIIEIGAVVVNENLEITDSFKQYVSPQYGLLDEYITNLTGVKYSDIQNASNFHESIEQFLQWIPKDSVIVSWSDNDKYQIEKELQLKDINLIEFDNYFDTWEDCQQEFSEKMNATKIYSLSEALVSADIDYDENIHDALVDAHNTALLFIKMKKEKVLKLNEHYNDDSSTKAYTYNTFEEMLLNNNNKTKKNKK